MIDWMINYMKWWVIFVVPTLLIGGIWYFIVWYKSHTELIPDSITIQCNKCGEVHKLKVIKLLSKKRICYGVVDGKHCHFMKCKYVVWCSKKNKFDTLYQTITPKNSL